MADATYQPKVYMKQGGDEQVIANGGVETVESGGEIAVQSGGVATLESGGKITAESGGEFEVQSGGFFDVQDGALMYLVNSSMTAAQLKDRLYDAVTNVTIAQGAGSTVLSVVNLPRDARYVFLSMTSTMVTASFWLTSCVVGQEVYIKMKPGSCASGTIVISTSGCSLVNVLGGAISGLTLKNSAASQGMVHLVCMKDDEWSVVGVSSAASAAE